MEAGERTEYRFKRVASGTSAFSKFKVVVILAVAEPALFVASRLGANNVPKQSVAGLAIAEVGLFAVMMWLGRDVYLGEVLKAKNERVVLDADGFSHVDYRGEEDFRARYNEIVSVAPKEGPEPRWLIKTRDRSLELSYQFEGIRDLLDRLMKAAPADATKGFEES